MRELLPADRCDKCGAGAYFAAVIGELELLFCGHHGKEYRDALILQGFIVHDQTARLKEKVPVYV